MSSIGLLAHFIKRDRKKQGVSKLPLWLTVIGSLVLVIFSVSLIYSLANQPQLTQMNVVNEPSPSSALQPIENPELYVDKEKAISFVYPKDTHRVNVDGESEYNRVSSAEIPDSFTNMKGYEPPQVAWALKVEDKKPFQGRYGEEASETPFSVWVFENPEKMSVQNWFDKYWYYPFIWGEASQSEVEKMRPVFIGKIDGLQAYGYDSGPSPRGYRKEIYIQNGNKMYLFELTGAETDSLEDQIIASFNFLLPEENK